MDQRQHVLPLQYRGVLKLIYKDMFESFAQALIDERHAKVAHHRVEQLVEFRDMHHLFLLGQMGKLLANQDTERIQIEQVKLRIVKQILTILFLIKHFKWVEYGE